MGEMEQLAPLLKTTLSSGDQRKCLVSLAWGLCLGGRQYYYPEGVMTEEFTHASLVSLMGFVELILRRAASLSDDTMTGDEVEGFVDSLTDEAEKPLQAFHLGQAMRLTLEYLGVIPRRVMSGGSSVLRSGPHVRPGWTIIDGVLTYDDDSPTEGRGGDRG